MDGTTLSSGRAADRPGRGAPAFRFSTADYAPRERLAVWQEIYGRSLSKQDVEPIDTEMFGADVIFRKLPDLSTMTGSRSAAIYRRNRNQLDGDNLFVTVALAGGFEATQLGRTSRMAVGDALVGTGAEPITARVFGGYRSITLSVPLRVISSRVTALDAAFGRRIPAENPALRLLTRYVDLIEELDDLASPELKRNAVTHVHDLLVLALGATRDAAAVAKLRGGRAACLRDIKTDVERRLGDEDLSIASIAARHRLPVRYVQRLFEADGTTFTEFVLERRLARAHCRLGDPRLDGESIGTIAFEAGFTNQAYFNRAFRSRYGTSPSDVRAQAKRGD
jgi:AraC-like DNA-binding protein